MGHNQAIVLGNLVENGPGGTHGADGFHILDVAEQRQAANDVVHIDVALKHHVRLAQVHMGNILPHIADRAGKETVGKGLVNDLAVQGVAVDRGFRGLSGGLGGGFLRGLRHGGRRLGRLSLGGFRPAAAAKQQRQDQQQRSDSFHSSHPFTFPKWYDNCRKTAVYPIVPR